MTTKPSMSSISDPDEVPFTPVGDGFIRKHGRMRCPCCRKNGIDRIVEIAPAISGSARKKAAVCRDHEADGKIALSREWESSRPDYSDASFSLGIR